MQYHLSSELHIVTLLTSMASRMEHLDKRSVQSGSSFSINRALVAVHKHLNSITAISVSELRSVGAYSKQNWFGGTTWRRGPISCKNHDRPPWGLEKLESIDSFSMKGSHCCVTCS